MSRHQSFHHFHPRAKKKKELDMAKKKAGKSLSQSIREHLKANPTATPNQIVEALATQGVKVSPSLAANVKYTSGTGATKKRATGGKKRTVKRKKPSVQTVDISALQAAAKFVAAVGDADKAIAAVKQVQSLQIG